MAGELITLPLFMPLELSFDQSQEPSRRSDSVGSWYASGQSHDAGADMEGVGMAIRRQSICSSRGLDTHIDLVKNACSLWGLRALMPCDNDS